MKQELPLAVILLASGILLWWFSGNEENWIEQPSSDTVIQERSPTETSLPDLPPPSTDSNDSSRVVRASFQSDQQDQDASRPTAENPLLDERRREEARSDAARKKLNSIELQQASSNRSAPAVAPLSAFLHSSPDQRTVDILAQLARTCAQSPPLGASIHLRGALFGQSITAQGRYFQAGQGTHQSRLELTFGDHPESPTLFQICDGRFVYRLESSQREQRYEFVNLIRIQEQAGEASSHFSPTGWVATGGISSLLQHLASGFNFGAPQPVDAEELAVQAGMPTQGFLIRGSWNLEALKQMVGQTHPEVFGQGENKASKSIASVRWQQIPPQLPHGVEIEFAPSALTGHFIKRISFVQFRRSSEDNGGTVPTPIAIVAFSEPQQLESVNDQMFIVNDSNSETIDATERYLARIQSIQKVRLAERQTNEK